MKISQHIFSIAIILFLMPSVSLAQIVSEVKTDSTGTDVPEAIKVVDIVKNIADANEELKLSAKKIRSGSSLRRIDSLFPGYVKFIKARIKSKNQFVDANPNRQKINNLIKKWEGYYDHLSKWEKEIGQYQERNLIVQELLVFKEKTWELTYKNAVKEKVPLEVLSNIKVTWRDYEKIIKQLDKQNNKYLVLESKINDQKLVVGRTMDDLTALKNSEVYDLFYLRHEPLWQSSFKEVDKVKGEKEEVESLSQNISGIYKFVLNSEHNLYLYVILVAFTVFLMRKLKKVFENYQFNEPDGNLQNAKDVIINRSVISIVFISLIIANWFFTDTPMLFGNILVFLILVLSVPLVQPYMYKRFKKIIYFVVILYVLDSLKTYMWFSTTQYRMYMLFEAFLVGGVLLAFTHPYLKTRKMNIGKFGLLLIRMTPVIYSLLLISVISNLLGYTNLTDLSLKISTQSGVISLIFYGILMIAGGITTGIIHWHFNTKPEFDQEEKFAVEMKLLKVIRVLAFIAWFLFFLGMIDLLAPLREFFTDKLSEPYKFGSITFTLGDVFRFILILSVSFLTTSVISYLFDSGEVSFKFLKLPKGIPAAISLVLRYFIIAFGIILALSSLGIDLSKFNLMAGALGLGIGFGLQTVISNFVSGLILVFERPIHVGDTVEVNNLLGTVNRIGVRSSSVSTFEGAEVIVPNNNLISNDLINWTLSDSVRRLEVIVGAKYGSDPNLVLKILREVALNNKHTLKNPAPVALFSEFGDSSLNFQLRFWVHYEIGLQVKSDISVAVYNEFEKHNIEIPFPQQDVHIKELPRSKDKTDQPKGDN